MEEKHIIHPFAPVYDSQSRVLILGTMPSPKSRENDFYYGNVQNRFWRVLSIVLGSEIPADNEGKIRFLLNHKIALWDVLCECDICGAADSSIKNAVPADLNVVLRSAPVKGIFATGKAAYKFYCKYQLPKTGIEAVCLPSTSPANARMGIEELVHEYSAIKKYLQ